MECTNTSGISSCPAPRPGQGSCGGSRGAGERDLGEQPGRRHLIASEEDAVTAVDGGPIAPGGAGQIYGSREPLHLHPPPPRLAPAPTGESSVEYRLQALHALLRRLAGCQARVALDQLVSWWGERRVWRSEALDPTATVEVGDGERVAPVAVQGHVEHGAAGTLPAQRVVAEQRVGVGEPDGDYRWRGGKLPHTRAGLYTHP